MAPGVRTRDEKFQSNSMKVTFLTSECRSIIAVQHLTKRTRLKNGVWKRIDRRIQQSWSKLFDQRSRIWILGTSYLSAGNLASKLSFIVRTNHLGIQMHQLGQWTIWNETPHNISKSTQLLNGSHNLTKISVWLRKTKRQTSLDWRTFWKVSNSILSLKVRFMKTHNWRDY